MSPAIRIAALGEPLGSGADLPVLRESADRMDRAGDVDGARPSERVGSVGSSDRIGRSVSAGRKGRRP